jgi:hypothetical protein
VSAAEQNYLSSGGLATGEHRPWPQALRSRVTAAIEAVQALDIDDALLILEDLAGDLAALDHAYESTSAAATYDRWKATNMNPRLEREGEGGP